MKLIVIFRTGGAMAVQAVWYPGQSWTTILVKYGYSGRYAMYTLLASPDITAPAYALWYGVYIFLSVTVKLDTLKQTRLN